MPCTFYQWWYDIQKCKYSDRCTDWNAISQHLRFTTDITGKVGAPWSIFRSCYWSTYRFDVSVGTTTALHFTHLRKEKDKHESGFTFHGTGYWDTPKYYINKVINFVISGHLLWGTGCGPFWQPWWQDWWLRPANKKHEMIIRKCFAFAIAMMHHMTIKIIFFADNQH